MNAAEAEGFDRGEGTEDVERRRRALDEQERGHLRLRADFDNFRRRSAQEAETARRGDELLRPAEVVVAMDAERADSWR